jgi:hypothetical protein
MWFSIKYPSNKLPNRQFVTLSGFINTTNIRNFEGNSEKSVSLHTSPADLRHQTPPNWRGLEEKKRPALLELHIRNV